MQKQPPLFKTDFPLHRLHLRQSSLQNPDGRPCAGGGTQQNLSLKTFPQGDRKNNCAVYNGKKTWCRKKSSDVHGTFDHRDCKLPELQLRKPLYKRIQKIHRTHAKKIQAVQFPPDAEKFIKNLTRRVKYSLNPAEKCSIIVFKWGHFFRRTTHGRCKKE